MAPSCKGKRDFGAKLGLFWDIFGSLVPIETKSQIWDLIGSTVDDTGGQIPGSDGRELLWSTDTSAAG